MRPRGRPGHSGRPAPARRSSRGSACGGSSWRSPRSVETGRGGSRGRPGRAERPGSPTALGTVLKELGKLLSAHFDIERVVEFFLDAITELVRPGRVALLLVDDEHRYRPRGFRGLDPELAERLRLESGEGLADWFRQHVRLAVRDELEREPDWLDAARELALLGGEVAVPLWVQAKLVGILVLGPRVTGQPYGSEDLERLFTLASQVAMAVEDISLFNTVRAQHGFIEQVLTHLQSGAITIDAAGRVTRFNRRAEQILELSLGDVLGQDLRVLPSPLGDLLYETMRGGRELRLVEVELPRRQTTLEVSTSRIVDAAGAPCGAVMLLDDPTPRHKLHRERQTSQTLDLLNRVLLRLTDEIKNPLVSIYTFLELLPQRYEDPEFRETFLSVVGKDTQRLISLVDKLITLAGDRDYKVDFCDFRQLLHDALEDLSVRPRAVAGAARRRALPAPGPGARRAADGDPLRAAGGPRRQGRPGAADQGDRLPRPVPRQPRRGGRARGHPPADGPGRPRPGAPVAHGTPRRALGSRARAPVQPARDRLGQAARRRSGRDPEDRRSPRRDLDARRPGRRDPLRPDAAANPSVS